LTHPANVHHQSRRFQDSNSYHIRLMHKCQEVALQVLKGCAE